VVTVIECAAFGPIEDLRIVEREPATLSAGQVRLAVLSAGVNFVDGLLVEGRYQIKPPLPFVPGGEIVGRVTELGEGVDGLSVGDRMFASIGFGGFASEVVVSPRQLVAIPDSLTDGQAATFMQSYLTGWYALRVRAGASVGDTMLVLGAGSGVGLAAVDIGAALGLRVIAAASTPEKRALAESRGAMATIDNSAIDAAGIKDAAKAFAATFDDRADRGGVDLIYDPVGGEVGEVALRALGEDGQYLVIGFVAGIPKLPANQVLLRNRRVTGVDWGAWVGRHQDENRAMLAEVVDRIASGDLDPVEPVSYPLHEAARALRDLADRKVAGKVALVPTD
jgi:NADPH2:quinone reductase